MRCQLFLLSFVLVASTTLSNVTPGYAIQFDQNVIARHVGNNDPETEDTPWVLSSGSNPAVVAAGPGTENIGGTDFDFWFTEDNGTGAGQFLNYQFVPSTSDLTNPWTLRTRVRVENTPGTDQALLLNDGTHRWGVWIRNNDLLRPTLASFHSSDFQSNYREIQLLFQPVTPGTKSSGDMVSVYVDDVLIETLDRTQTLASTFSPSLIFGGSSSAGTGEARWNAVEFVEGNQLAFVTAIPEPTTLMPLALGLAAVVSSRRRRLRSQRRTAA